MKHFLLVSTLALGSITVAIPDSPKPAPPKVAPISYFEDRCARCHGPQGSFYGDSFGKKLTEEALHKVVYDMCRNQGEMKLEGVDLDAQIAYHRSMIAKEPFIVLMSSDNGILVGEVPEKTEVKVKFKRSSTTTIGVRTSRWSVAIPKGEKLENCVITATLNKHTTTLIPKKSAFSHAEPLLEAKGTKP